MVFEADMTSRDISWIQAANTVSGYVTVCAVCECVLCVELCTVDDSILLSVLSNG